MLFLAPQIFKAQSQTKLFEEWVSTFKMNKQFLIFLFVILNTTSFKAQNWMPLASELNRAVRTAFQDTIDNVVYFSGHFEYIDGIEVNGICKWDGEQFYPLGTAQTNCSSMLCNNILSIIRFQDEIYIHAADGPIGDIFVQGIARWDGIQWDSVELGLYYSTGTSGVVRDMLIKDNELYVFGQFDYAGNIEAYSAAKWDGENWYSLGIPDFPTSAQKIYTALFFNDELYIGGNFKLEYEGEIYKDIAKFNGTEWIPVGGGIQGALGDVAQIIEYKEELYFVGNFHAYNGDAANKIMKLQGNHFVQVGDGFNEYPGVIRSAIVYHDELYVNGSFSFLSDSIECENIAKWDGEKWCCLGSDFEGWSADTDFLVVYDDELIVGGNFKTIDGDSIPHLAQWIGGDYVDTCGAIINAVEDLNLQEDNFKLFPNPSQSKVSLLFESEYIATAQVDIYNTLGTNLYSRSIRQVSNQYPFSFSVEDWAKGIYFVRVELGNGDVYIQKLVVQ